MYVCMCVGLEEQLLGRVIQKEQRSLEESLKNVLEEVKELARNPDLTFSALTLTHTLTSR